MKPPCCNHPERGVFLPLVAVLLAVLLAFVGLAADAGNMYRTRARLQRAADAAALAGLGHRVLKGWEYFNAGAGLGVPGAKDDEASARAAEALAGNLTAAGITLAESTQAIAFNSLTDTMEVRVSYELPLRLMSYIPGQFGCDGGLSHTCTVSVVSRIELRPANVGLVLDTSGSMACPRDGSDCSACQHALPPNDCNTVFGPSNNQVIVALKEAVRGFTSFFNPNRDRINIVPFNIVADPSYFSVRTAAGAAVPFGESQARLDAFFDKIDSLVPRSSTNMCDGLLTSFQDFAAANPPVLGNENSFFLLFTDGAPNAGRFSFSNRRPSLDLLLAAGLRNDFIQYSIMWTVTGGTYNRPSPLVYRDSMPFNWVDGVPPAGVPTCGAISSVAGAPADAAFGNCIDDFSFRLPGAGGTSSGGGVSFELSAHQYYHCAIEMADRVRAQRGSVYTIALGKEAPPSSDPYQDPGDDFSRKDYFLRRVAYDQYHGSADPDFKPHGIVRNGTATAVGYAEHRGYPELDADPAVRDLQGESYGTDDPNQLQDQFIRVAKSILMALIP